MKNNPYSLLFGKEPNQMISRQVQRDGLLEAFTRKVSPEQIFMITGKDPLEDFLVCWDK